MPEWLMHWTNGVLGGSLIYAAISVCQIMKCSK